MGFLLSLVLKTLVVAANGAGILSLMILLASWLFVLPGTPFEMVLRGVSVEMLRGTSVEWVLRGLSVETGGNVYTLGGYAYDLSAFHQLTPSWDWERLRLGATIWVFVELLGLWTTRGNPIPFVTAGVTAATIGLALLQYTAFGGGQPVWGMEHLVKHLMVDVAGLDPTDFEALRHFARDNLAARTYPATALQHIDLQSQAALIAIAILLAGSIRSLGRLTLLPGHNAEQQAGQPG